MTSVGPSLFQGFPKSYGAFIKDPQNAKIFTEKSTDTLTRHISLPNPDCTRNIVKVICRDSFPFAVACQQWLCAICFCFLSLRFMMVGATFNQRELQKHYEWYLYQITKAFVMLTFVSGVLIGLERTVYCWIASFHQYENHCLMVY